MPDPLHRLCDVCRQRKAEVFRRVPKERYERASDVVWRSLILCSGCNDRYVPPPLPPMV